MHADIERILIVRLSHLGDVVHAWPVARALRLAHPRARIGWVVEPRFAGILDAVADVDEVIRFERHAGLAGWARLERELTRFAADWAIDAQGNLKSAFVTLGSRAPRRTGMARADWTEPLGSVVLTESAPAAARRSDGTVHALDRMFVLARHVAPGVTLDDRAHAFGPGARGEAAFAERFGASTGPFAILHLAAEGDVRSYASEHFESLARELAADHDVLLVSGPGEREAGARAAARLKGFPRIRHWVGQADLADFAGLLAAAAARDAVFVGCDSGPMHVAWAAGLRVTLLAGPQDERRTGPWPPANRSLEPVHQVVRASPPPHCAPCLARRCHHPGGNVCMQRITPAEIAASVRSGSLRAVPTAS
jgi:ADP-heptose:LPS heptosyltransferase